MSSEAPPRGTRPRNRRALIRDAAAVLFAERGYARVSLVDVAAAVNVGPSAIYRHFPGKAELLFDVVDSALDLTAVSRPDLVDADLGQVVAGLAANTLDHRLSGLLWQRESRNLPPAERVTLGKKVTLAQRWLAAQLVAREPEVDLRQAELLAACCLDALTSVSFHHLSLPRHEFERLLTEIGLRVLDVRPPATDVRSRTRKRTSSSRADELVDAAIRLFALHGYAAVSLDDIGAAVGIAGPSIYKHFESKQDLLVAGMERGAQQLQQDLATAMVESASTEDALRRVTASYVALALQENEGVSLLIGETIHLDVGPRRHLGQLQRRFVDDWQSLLCTYRPSYTSTEARIRVHAAQMVANNIGRTPRLRRAPAFHRTVLEVCWAIQQ